MGRGESVPALSPHFLYIKVYSVSCSIKTNADNEIMKAVNYEDCILAIDELTESLVKDLLSFNAAGIVSQGSEKKYFTIDKLKPTLDLDLLTILLYQKQYGKNKLKALLKPWVANVVQIFSAKHVLYTIDENGRCKLYVCRSTENFIDGDNNFFRSGEQIKIAVPVI